MRTASRLNSSLCIAAISGLLDGEYCSQKTGTKPVQVQPVRRRAGAASRDRTVDDGRREVGRAGNRPEDDETRPRYPLTYRSKASFSAPFHRASAPRRPSETNRRRGMDEDRPQRGRHQRSGGVRRRDQPLYRTRPRHLHLRRNAALQGGRQHHGTDARAARAERHDGNPRLDGRDQRRPRHARHGALAADHGAAHGRRHRRLQGYFRAAGGYFAAVHTFFCGCKIGNRRAYVVSVSARGAGNGSSPLLSVLPP